MSQPQLFLSCDWGTSSFRLRLAEAHSWNVLAETKSKDGNAALHEAWQKNPEQDRLSYYLAVLQQRLSTLEQQCGKSLAGVPLLISGMASSTIGMKELQYKPLPFALDGSDLLAERLDGGAQISNTLLLISGARTADDVMRGEECQTVGCARLAGLNDGLLLHPGTHCKHIVLSGGKAIGFRTFMSGELFALLNSKSILAASVEVNDWTGSKEQQLAFAEGVDESTKAPLLHQIFMVRTATLFEKRSKPENFHYLSGLIIGTELQSLRGQDAGTLILTGSDGLVAQYSMALELLGLARQESLIIVPSDKATLAGQYLVYSHQ